MSLSLCKCGGEGTVEKDGKLYECVCAALRRVSAGMPAYIRRAMVMPTHLTLPVIGMTAKSVFLIGSWPDVKAVIKAVMIKNMKISVQITSDREIRDVFVGSTSRAAKGADADAGVMNSLRDLMDPPSLSIVRLNELSYRNKAAPGALEEALTYRVDRDRPTWVVSDTSKPFGQGSFAYSDSVMELLLSAFHRVTIPQILNLDEMVAAQPPLLIRPAVQDLDADPLPPRQASPGPKRPRETVQAVALEKSGSGLDLYGSGISGPTRQGRRGFRKSDIR